MYYKKRVIGLTIVFTICAVLGSSLLNPAEGAEQFYDVTPCISGDMTILAKTKQITILCYDAKGIMRSNNESKAFHNFTLHATGVIEIEGKNRTVYGHMKYLDPNGDFIVFRYTKNPGDEAATTKILAGTGKWKGITGGGKAKTVARGKPIVAGTFQLCNTHKGTFTLPK